MRASLVISNAEVEGILRDVMIADGRIAAVVPPGVGTGDRRVDAEGGALIPGLVDHHLHLMSMAAHREAMSLHRRATPTMDDVAHRLATASPDTTGWIRGVDFDAVQRGTLTASRIDAMRGDVPVRVQDRSGALWMLNSAALRAIDVETFPMSSVERDEAGQPTGVLWRADTALRERLPKREMPDLSPVIDDLLSWGITEVTDATPDLSGDALAHIRQASWPLRVHLLGTPHGWLGSSRLSAGPSKVVLADSSLPDLDDLAFVLDGARQHGRGIAMHTVTLESLYLALELFDMHGTHPDDRLEHVALAPDDAVAAIARLGLRVISQPGFLADRGDLLCGDDDESWLYRAASFRNAGVRFALSSDAPYGPANPWRIIDSAVTRRAPHGVMSATEQLTPAQALATLWTPAADPGGAVRRITAGGVADVVLLAEPLHDALASARSTRVRSVLIDGRVEFEDGIRVR